MDSEEFKAAPFETQLVLAGMAAACSEFRAAGEEKAGVEIILGSWQCAGEFTATRLQVVLPRPR